MRRRGTQRSVLPSFCSPISSERMAMRGSIVRACAHILITTWVSNYGYPLSEPSVADRHGTSKKAASGRMQTFCSCFGLAKNTNGDVRRFRMRMIVGSIRLDDIEIMRPYPIRYSVGRMMALNRIPTAHISYPLPSFGTHQRTCGTLLYSVPIKRYDRFVKGCSRLVLVFLLKSQGSRTLRQFCLWSRKLPPVAYWSRSREAIA
jgi:hypothetical protein